MREYMDVVKEATELHAAGHIQKAAILYENLLGAQPDDSIVKFLYGSLYSQNKQFGTAITMLKAAVEGAAQEIPEAWHNLGISYRNEGHSEKAREAYARALEIDPKNAHTLAMMSGAYVNVGQPEKAIEYADRALEIEPEDPQAMNHRALACLELGRWKEAWPAYESRFRLDLYSAQLRTYPCPRWNGKKTGKLVIHGEQGLGDEILFMSCFEEAKKTANEIVIECSSRLIPLFERSFGVKCYGTEEEVVADNPDLTACIPMGSLPGLYRLSDDSFPRKAFLKADEDKTRAYKSKMDGFTVGIAWHGGTKGTHQELRNASMSFWKNLIEENQDKSFISLQYGEDGIIQANQLLIPHWQDALDDIDNQAALINACDLIISVCQTAIHIAGGLGNACWCLTPDHAAWRYGISGEMLWYHKNLELIRQNGAGWEGVFAEVGKRLKNVDQ